MNKCDACFIVKRGTVFIYTQTAPVFSESQFTVNAASNDLISEFALSLSHLQYNVHLEMQHAPNTFTSS